MRCVRGALVALLLFCFPPIASVRAEDWPQWRGPRLDGSSHEKGLPLKWSAKDNIVWKAKVPGIGHSSPIVVGDRVYVTSCLLKEEKRMLYCFDRRTGDLLWDRHVLSSPLEPKHGLNSFASSTPAADADHVYVSFLKLRKAKEGDKLPKFNDSSWAKKDLYCQMEVVCYTHKGDEVWRKNPGLFFSRHGFCSPPILYKDMVIVNGDQDADGFITALDRKDGSERWRIDRPNHTRSYCAPLIVQAAGRMQMVLTGSFCTTSYDPDSGKLIWIVDGPTEQFVASPVYGEGLIFLTAGFPTFHNMAIRPDGAGNVTKTHVVWHEKTSARKASYVPSPLAYDKWFYMISDLGPLSCFEAKSGTRLWMEELGRHHSASPVLIDGHVYMTDDDGITYVIKGGASFDLVARNELNEKCYSSPAVSQGRILLRTTGHLWSIGPK
ncbi:MAG: PQQ-binding-like beta-propeller repeat protein [Gemmataceae bacterium]